MIWALLFFVGAIVALTLYAACRVGGQSDELMDKIRRAAEAARKGGK